MESMPGLEVASPKQPGLEAVYPGQVSQFNKFYPQYEKFEEKRVRRVCGLKRKTFWISVAVAVVIIVAAALGGGLGGGLSQRNRNLQQQQQQQQPTQTAQSTQPSQTTQSTQPKQSTQQTQNITAEVGTVDGETRTLYRDCPSSNNTSYSVQFNSTTYEFRKLCNMQAMVVGGDTAYVNEPVGSLNDCINLCAAWNENNVTKANSDQICSSACWRNTFDNDEYPGQCFGYNGNNASATGGFYLQADPNCDSAIWINQS